MKPTPTTGFGRGLLLAAITCLLAVPTAADELYRCTAPDGGTVFTNDLHACPNATKHESVGVVQTLPTAAPASSTRSSAPRNSPRSLDHDAAQKARWQTKKRQAEDELRRLEQQTAYSSRFVAGCNRGSAIITEDADGIERTVPCSEIRREHEQLVAKLEPLRDYLAHGLERECRKSGCLPGWIR